MSEYIFDCHKCGERVSILRHKYMPNVYEVVCPKCQRAEYGGTLEKAIRCFKAVDNDRAHMQDV